MLKDLTVISNVRDKRYCLSAMIVRYLLCKPWRDEREEVDRGDLRMGKQLESNALMRLVSILSISDI